MHHTQLKYLVDQRMLDDQAAARRARLAARFADHRKPRRMRAALFTGLRGTRMRVAALIIVTTFCVSAAIAWTAGRPTSAAPIQSPGSHHAVMLAKIKSSDEAVRRES